MAETPVVWLTLCNADGDKSKGLPPKTRAITRLLLILGTAARHCGAGTGEMMMLLRLLARLTMALLLALAMVPVLPAAAAPFRLEQALAYPVLSDLVATPDGKRIAWVRTVAGVRNIWVADAPGFAPRQVTQFTADDGQELTQLAFTPDGSTLVFVRGGDHDGNWPATGNLQPNPAADPAEPKITLWRAGLAPGAKAAKITEGDEPLLSAKGDMAFLRDGQVWTAKLKVTGEADNVRRAFFDRGKARDLAWSPDGSRLAFVSRREGHSLIGVWQPGGSALAYLAPSTMSDGDPVWSPDSKRIAFTRRAAGLDGYAGFLAGKAEPEPWSIWVAEVASGTGRRVWASATTLRASYPDVTGGANLHWAGDRLVFLSAETNWQQLYSVPAAGGGAQRLTGDGFMVEHVAPTADGNGIVFSANTGTTQDDDTRRHVFRVAAAGGKVEALTAGDGLEWTPVGIAGGGAAVIAAGARTPGAVAIADGGKLRVLDGQAPPADFAGASFVVPRRVTFQAPDGLIIHGQLFDTGGNAKKPAVIFVHGGPPRQMLLGFSYMRYYANAYALNQYLASRGFAVLSVNFRLGIGYGHDFQHPDKGGPMGASEYQDVLAAARWLQAQPNVDPGRLGIWGGSYGGLLTAQALARNSDVFKAGVDIHGVHDWSRVLIEEAGTQPASFGDTDRRAALEIAWKASPVADIAGWRSPVLLIHGDDDRNVRINQSIDLAQRLTKQGVDFEELVIPNEMHDFLRHSNWLKVDAATAEYLERQLKP